MSNHAYTQGFTLLQLAMALVIISLIVGGIVAGQDLIKSSEVRAQIAQINQYNSATAAFVAKYEFLPGDIKLAIAAQYGFYTDSSCDGLTKGQRNGDWMIQGRESGVGIFAGESGLFWQDLSTAGLIDQNFPNSGAPYVGCGASPPVLSLKPGTTYVGDYFPRGKLGYGTFVYVYNGLTAGLINVNWYGLSVLTGVNNNNQAVSSTGISVLQAYKLDKKFDDGLPTSGTVQAQYLNTTANTVISAPSAASDSTATCYNTNNNTYSTSSAANGGTGLNCAVSFQFQN